MNDKSGRNKDMGEAWHNQHKAEGSSKSKIGGIESGDQGKKPGGMFVPNYGAYAAQEHAEKGLHGQATDSKGSILPKGGVPYGKANAEQSHWKGENSKPELMDETALNRVKGKDGAYLGHFRQEKYLRQGHNSDGMIPLAPAGGAMSPSNQSPANNQANPNGGGIAQAIVNAAKMPGGGNGGGYP